MSIEKITPQIAGMYLGQKCDVEWLCSDPCDPSFVKGEKWHDSRIGPSHISRLQKDEITITLHLRSIDTITEEDCRFLYLEETGEVWVHHYLGKENIQLCKQDWFQDEYKSPIGSPMVWLKMLEMGFDLFGLIPAGLAKEIKYGK